jgi:hypothetical protein
VGLTGGCGRIVFQSYPAARDMNFLIVFSSLGEAVEQVFAIIRNSQYEGRILDLQRKTLSLRIFKLIRAMCCEAVVWPSQGMRQHRNGSGVGSEMCMKMPDSGPARLLAEARGLHQVSYVPDETAVGVRVQLFPNRQGAPNAGNVCKDLSDGRQKQVGKFSIKQIFSSRSLAPIL